MARRQPSNVPAVRINVVDDVPLIGWREWIALPGLKIDPIKAKIDSGARTSAIHAFDIQAFTERGSPHVSFIIHPDQRRSKPAVACVAAIQDERVVKSSSGHQQRRYVIEVEVSVGDYAWPIELTLADRDPMGFRMLLGREAIRQRFLIDPSRSFLIGRSFADITTIFTSRKKMK